MGKIAINKKKTEGEINTTGWMTTFTNLMILLLAFFIVLVNMGVQDQKKKKLAINSLFGSFGIKPGGQSALGSSEGSDITMGDAPMFKKEIDYEKLRNIVTMNGFGPDVDINMELDKIVIILNNRVMFGKESTTILTESAGFLLDLSAVLKEGPGTIELRGYADQTETLLAPDPLESSLYLSAARALSVLHFLVEKGKVSVSRIVSHGFGIPPKKKKTSGKRKDWDGRVEIIVDYRQKIPYRLRVKKQIGRLLDFKGFIFKF